MGQGDTGTPMVEEYMTKMPIMLTGGLQRAVIKHGKRGLSASNQQTLNQATYAIAKRESTPRIYLTAPVASAGAAGDNGKLVGSIAAVEAEAHLVCMAK